MCQWNMSRGVAEEYTGKVRNAAGADKTSRKRFVARTSSCKVHVLQKAEPGVAVASVFRLSIFTIEEPRKGPHPSEELQGCGASLGTKLGFLHEFFVLGVVEARALFGKSSCLKIKCGDDKNEKDELVSLILAFGT
jgi:hypothetical protein